MFPFPANRGPRVLYMCTNSARVIGQILSKYVQLSIMKYMAISKITGPSQLGLGSAQMTYYNYLRFWKVG